MVKLDTASLNYFRAIGTLVAICIASSGGERRVAGTVRQLTRLNTPGSTVSDCLHLQLYRDSKDRYKQGQTKASLSLQHFLAVESGFTLDKESNTIAIICQDVTVVLAFDTRERLIQWQVKIANNLGEDQQFLIQIASAPPRAKISTGPARLHVQEYRFCLTVGVPSRLIGFWEISQLRRYGVVENRFCFEGGSRCGRGEGVYVLMTDQGEEICQSLTLAAEGKLTTRRGIRSSSRNISADSPRKMRSEMRFTELSSTDSNQENALCCGCPSCHNNDDNLWPSTETRPDTCDYGDTTSVAEYTTDSHNQDGRVWTNEHTLERCMSCISKLGAMSRSSTAANTPGTGFSPAWTMEPSSSLSCQLNQADSCNGSNQNCNAEYATPRYNPQETRSSFGNAFERCHFCPPTRPPKPLQLIPNQNSSPLKKKSKKPPMPLPTPQQPPTCSCSHRASPLQNVNPYDNYDDEYESEEYYDTPKNIKENLGTTDCYSNYDILPSATVPVHTPSIHTRNAVESEEWRPVVCPCQRMFGWAENWMILPYCRRGNGIENTSLSFHKVKLDGEGKMPVVNSSGEIAIYATVDKLKKARDKEERLGMINSNPNHTPVNVSQIAQKRTEEIIEGASNYVNVESSEISDQDQNISVQSISENSIAINYANMDFAQSLEYYENARDLVSRAGIKQISSIPSLTGDNKHNEQFSVDKSGIKYCNKCGHPCKLLDDLSNLPDNETDKKPAVQDDYLMMEPAKVRSSEKCSEQNSFCSSSASGRGINFPGYLPMSPIPVGSTVQTVVKQDLIKHHFNQEVGLLVEKAASVPSLVVSSLNRSRKRSDSEFIRVPGSAMLGVNQPLSTAASPYLRRHLINCSTDSKDDTRSCNSYTRKRSSSADSTRYIDNLESITERTVSSSSSTQINHSDNSKNTSIDSLSSQTISLKRVEDSCNDNENSACNSGVVESEVRESEASVKEELVGNDSDSMKSDSLRTLMQECYQQGPSTPVHIRRSSSIPCKSGHNRDSSSSNDSGVSIASLKHRGADFAEFELPLTTSKSARRHHAAITQRLYFSNHGNCLHASLPRRSKSSDPLQELTFQFQKIPIPAKSSSAEAEVPVYSTKRDALRGCLSPAGDGVIASTYLDSRSTSSGTSDMSDYFETLSLSSYSSSDTPDSLRLGRPATTTLRPRSGKEYHKIDRYILEGDIKKPQFGGITTVPEKSETIPQGCSSGASDR
ncbi:uncharacterized protein LOC142317819 [Lycorma delicatula]|uniref:uncharacterized protein LOC142317819 n=1 Tax=Lycorma delicatula TaxID=130591 RepID=UPI003F512532